VVPPETLDLVVVPALAIDGAGHRLGYGRGYYDQTLVRTVNAVTVGVAFDFQLIAEVPIEAHDVPVAWVVTDQRTLRASSDDGRDPPENR
jgi:5-formyltetrahydrofolate cyclo-ligase